MPTITPLQPLFAARIGGLDLTRDLDDATFATVRDAFERYSVLVFPGQTISDAQQIRFSERFGPLEATRAGANGAGWSEGCGVLVLRLALQLVGNVLSLAFGRDLFPLPSMTDESRSFE